MSLLRKLLFYTTLFRGAPLELKGEINLTGERGAKYKLYEE